MATFWAKNGSACFQFRVPIISLLFIPLGCIHPQEWKIRVQIHNILVKKSWFLFDYSMRIMRIMWIWCASAKIGAWPTLFIRNIQPILAPKLRDCNDVYRGKLRPQFPHHTSSVGSLRPLSVRCYAVSSDPPQAQAQCSHPKQVSLMFLGHPNSVHFRKTNCTTIFFFVCAQIRTRILRE